jgi:quercetin dioxygenase-like cupin family protein
MIRIWPLAVLALAASPALAQDAVKVDPAHHKVALENEHVRVLRATLKPGEKTPSHQHPAVVAVFLTDSQFRITSVGAAAPDETPRKAGDVVAVPATTHVAENIGKTTSEVVVVELKAPPAGKPVAKSADKVDPKHYTLVTENDRVRVLRVRYGPKEKSIMHEHPALVAIPISRGQMRMHLADGKVEESPALEPGQALFMPAVTHAPENVGGVTEVILVELKSKGM